MTTAQLEPPRWPRSNFQDFSAAVLSEVQGRDTNLCLAIKAWHWLKWDWTDAMSTQISVTGFSAGCDVLMLVCRAVRWRILMNWGLFTFKAIHLFIHLFILYPAFYTSGSQPGCQDPPRDHKVDLKGHEVIRNLGKIHYNLKWFSYEILDSFISSDLQNVLNKTICDGRNGSGAHTS